jgi:hypothetical protein
LCRHLDRDARAAARAAGDVDRAAGEQGALAHAHEPDRSRILGLEIRDAAPIVAS